MNWGWSRIGFKGIENINREVTREILNKFRA